MSAHPLSCSTLAHVKGHEPAGHGHMHAYNTSVSLTLFS